MKSISFLVVVCSFALTACTFGQVAQKTANTAPSDKASPCSNLGNPPTVGSCWDCFQNLLADCDRQNQEGNRRKACYDGANNFFTWCLGRATVPANPANPNAPRKSSMIRGAGFVYTLALTTPVDPANIVVYVRDMEAGEPRMQEVKSVAFANADGTVDIWFDNNNLGLEDDKVVGVVTTWVNPGTHAVEAAYADAYDLVVAWDLNGDGVVDAFDFSEAWERYSNGSMSFDEFIEFLSKYENH